MNVKKDLDVKLWDSEKTIQENADFFGVSYSHAYSFKFIHSLKSSLHSKLKPGIDFWVADVEVKSTSRGSHRYGPAWDSVSVLI